jgi:hypothetical protein
MRVITILILGAALLMSATVRLPVSYAHPQTSTDNRATGRVAGKIKPGHGSGFEVYLLVPGTGTSVAETSADFVIEGHRGEFVLDGIRPGIYRLDVSSLPGLGCGILPWSQTVAVESGKTTRVTIKLKVTRHARCE